MKFISKDISDFQDYNRKGYNNVYKQNNQYFQLNSHVLQIICEEISATKDNQIIDIGCGQGYLIEHLCKIGYYCHATDVSGIGIAQLKKRLGKSDKQNLLAKAGNVDNLKLTSQYSAIISTRLISYLTEIQSLTLIKKILESTAPGGYNFIDYIYIPNAPMYSNGVNIPLQYMIDIYYDWDIFYADIKKLDSKTATDVFNISIYAKKGG